MESPDDASAEVSIEQIKALQAAGILGMMLGLPKQRQFGMQGHYRADIECFTLPGQGDWTIGWRVNLCDQARIMLMKPAPTQGLPDIKQEL